MLDTRRIQTKFTVQCIACLGHGLLFLGEDRPTCKGCEGIGRFMIECEKEDADGFDDGPLWDRSVELIESRGAAIHDSADRLVRVGDVYECRENMSAETAAFYNRLIRNV